MDEPDRARAKAAFERAAMQFMVLRDAADAIEELKPADTHMAAYLRSTADDAVRRAHVPEEYLQAMISARETVGPTELHMPD